MDARRLQELDGHSVEAESNFEILRAQRAQVQRGVKLANGEGLGVRLIEDLLVSRNGMLGFCFRAKIFLGWWMILEWMKPSPMMNGIDTMVFRRR